MTPDFMRQKAKRDSISDSDAKIKRMSATERSETMDLSSTLPHNNLRRNNSFIESRNFLELPRNGQWTDLTSMHDATAKKPPPSVSPRSSIRRTKENGNGEGLVNGNAKINPLRSSSSMSSMKSDEANNIRRVQEKSNKFLEQLSQKESPKKKLITSASSSSIPSKMVQAVAKVPIEGQIQNHKLALEDIKKALARETHKRLYFKIKIVDDKKRASKFMQINEVYVSKASPISVNQIHKVRTKDDRNYHVRMKFNEIVPDGVIEVHPVLAKVFVSRVSFASI